MKPIERNERMCEWIQAELYDEVSLVAVSLVVVLSVGGADGAVVIEVPGCLGPLSLLEEEVLLVIVLPVVSSGSGAEASVTVAGGGDSGAAGSSTFLSVS